MVVVNVCPGCSAPVHSGGQTGGLYTQGACCVSGLSCCPEQLAGENASFKGNNTHLFRGLDSASLSCSSTLKMQACCAELASMLLRLNFGLGAMGPN